MEALSRLNVKAGPMILQDLQQVAELVYNSYSAASVILQKKIQQKQYFKKSVRASIPSLLKKQQQFNKKRNTNINFITKYTINGKIIGFVITFDMVLFLQAADKPGDFFQTEIVKILKIYDNQIKIGKDIYFGKSVVDTEYMSKGIARWMYYQRIQHLYQHGYTSMYLVAANPKVHGLAVYLGGKIYKYLVGKYQDGQTYQFPLFIIQIKAMNEIVENDLQKVRPKLSKL